MVTGLDSFRKHFRGYEDCYTVIGGAACDILMSDAGERFRATKDIDMIILMESRFAEFTGVFWDYIKAGGYRCGWRGSEGTHFYRFTEPKSAAYPKMIELLSRRPDFQAGRDDIRLSPLPAADGLSSLSAIMLDEPYYELMLSGRREIDGVSVLDTEYIIPFKAKAWLNLKKEREDGRHVNGADLRKHKNDVFRLLSIADPEKRVDLSPQVAGDMSRFLEAMPEEGVGLRDLGLGYITLEEALAQLYAIYQLKEPSLAL